MMGDLKAININKSNANTFIEMVDKIFECINETIVHINRYNYDKIDFVFIKSHSEDIANINTESIKVEVLKNDMLYDSMLGITSKLRLANDNISNLLEISTKLNPHTRNETENYAYTCLIRLLTISLNTICRIINIGFY